MALTREPKLIAPTRDTHAKWTAANPVLPEGVLAVTKGRVGSSIELVIGDGVTPYNDLPKFSGGSGGSSGGTISVEPAPLILPVTQTTLTLAPEHSARRIIFTSPNPCVVTLPASGLEAGFTVMVRNSGGGGLSVLPQQGAVIENGNITAWSEPKAYGSVLLEKVQPNYSYFLIGGIE